MQNATCLKRDPSIWIILQSDRTDASTGYRGKVYEVGWYRKKRRNGVKEKGRKEGRVLSCAGS